MAFSEKDIMEKINNPELPWFEKCIAIKAAGDQNMTKLEENFMTMIFEEKNPDICGELARSLVRICGANDSVLIKAFGLMIKDENSATRYAGVVGLGQTEASDYVGELLIMIDSKEDLRIRREIANTLGKVEDPRNKGVLLHELERLSKNPENITIKDTMLKAIEKLNGKAEAGMSADKSVSRAFGDPKPIQQFKLASRSKEKR